MTDGLTPAEAAEGLTNVVGRFGFDWMADADLRARGKSELGLRGRPLYHLGRSGVLGDVPAEVVIAVEAFFPPDVVRRAWEDRGDNQPRDVARWYAGGCADIARRRFPDDDRTGRAAGLLERVVDGADPAGLPLFATGAAPPYDALDAAERRAGRAGARTARARPCLNSAARSGTACHDRRDDSPPSRC